MTIDRAFFESVVDTVSGFFNDFDKSIRIIEEIETPDGQGGTDTSRVLFATTECFVFPMAGKENVEAGGLYTDQMFKFSMRPIPSLTNKMIIEYNGFDYKIESGVNLVEADVWINVMAERDKPE